MEEIVWYLAGKMSGMPKFNFPLFDRVAKGLRELGYKIISPAELDSPEIRVHALASEDGAGQGDLHGNTWGDFLSRDVKIVADEATGVILLPRWEDSRGARLEAYVGILCGHLFKKVNPDNFELSDMTIDEVREHL